LLAVVLVPACADHPTNPDKTLPIAERGVWTIESQFETFTAIDAVGDDVVAVSWQGTYRYNGSKWRRVGDGFESAYDIDIAADGTVFVITNGDVLRLDGDGWTRIGRWEGGGAVDMCAIRRDAVLIVGGTYLYKQRTPFVLLYDGSSWTSLGYPGGQLSSLWGASPDDVYVSGEKGLMYHFDGVEWTPVDSGTGKGLVKMWGRSADDIFAVGNAGAIVHYDGSEWQPLASGITAYLDGVWGDASGDLYVWSGNGTYHRKHGTEWVSRPVVAGDLSGVVTSGPSTMITSDNSLLQVDGDEVTRVRGGPPRNLNGVWTAPNGEVFAVGRSDAIERRIANGWYPMMGGTWQGSWFGVWGRSATDVYVVGTGGRILHYDGSGWSPIDSGTSNDLHGIWGDDNYTVAVGVSVVLINDGSGWVPMTGDISDVALRDVWGASRNELVAVGDGGTILQYDGSGWAKAESGVQVDLTGVWGSSREDVYVVGGVMVSEDGQASAILHFDGSEWVRMATEPIHVNLTSVWGAAESVVFAVGYEGLISSGKAGWQIEIDGNPVIYAIHGNGNRIYAVGGPRVYVNHQVPSGEG
jgi:hypothetical protein